MLGHTNNLYNAKFINSFKDSLNEALKNQSIIEDAHLGIMASPGDYSKVSDLQLQNRMRQNKRTNIFGGKAEQSKEYLDAEAEMNRRVAARNAPKTDGMKSSGKSIGSAIDKD